MTLEITDNNNDSCCKKRQNEQSLHDLNANSFASDNYAGAHPSVLKAIAAANGGHVKSYGADPYTAALGLKIKELFGQQAEFFPVLTGTGANVIALQALAARHESVICAKSAHIHVDEGGAPERLGIKLLTIPTENGKLTPKLLDSEAWGWGDQHRGQPGVISITQTTELGTIYSPEEISEIAEYAHSHGMKLHLDGARLANAAAALSLPVKAFTTDAGVDIVSFGATKNGAVLAEGVVILTPGAGEAIQYLRKGSSQLSSKMRFISAQYLALLNDDLWLHLADNANKMAENLAEQVKLIPTVRLAQAVQANAVFAYIDPSKAEALANELGFYVWDGSTGLVRWMTSWDTTAESVKIFVDKLRKAL